MLQEVYQRLGDAGSAAKNHNYLAAKREELSARIQAAEGCGGVHAALLGWDLASVHG
jgi:hypothetical protein